MITSKWAGWYVVLNFILLWSTSLEFFLVGSDSAYFGIDLILSEGGDHVLPTQNIIDFSRFSYQWLGVIMAILLFILLTQKNLKLIMSLSNLSTVIIFFGITFILCSAITSLISHPPSFKMWGPSDMHSISLFGEMNLLTIVYFVSVL